MKQIILIEPDLNGHHEMFLIAIIKTCISLYDKIVIITAKKNVVLPEILLEKGLDLAKIEIAFIKYDELKPLPKAGLYKKLLVLYNLLLVVINSINIRRIVLRNPNSSVKFFCCIDSLLHDLMPVWLFSWLFPFEWNCLTLISNSSTPITLLDRRRLFASKYCKKLYALGESGCFFKQRYNIKLYPFPDFSTEEVSLEDTELVKQIKQKAKGRTVISLLGAITYRKGIFNFVKCFPLLDTKDYFFVIAGNVDMFPPDLKTLEQNLLGRENCFYYPYRISSDAEFNDLVRLSSVLYAAYIGFPYSSNMIAKACLFKKYLIVSDYGYMYDVTTKYQLGLSINPNSPDEAANAINCLFNGTKALIPDYKSYLEYNSIYSLIYIFSSL